MLEMHRIIGAVSKIKKTKSRKITKSDNIEIYRNKQ